MSLGLITIVCLILIVAVVIILSVSGQYTLEREVPDIPQLLEIYAPPRAWGWDDQNTSIPVPGKTGECNVYTFIAPTSNKPARPRFGDITQCVSTGPIVCTTPPVEPDSTPEDPVVQTCVDDDQLLAQQRRHRCIGNPLSDDRTGTQCRTLSGQLVDPGTVEDFFTPCGRPPKDPTQSVAEVNAGRCPGTIGVLLFGADLVPPSEIWTGSWCVDASVPLSVNRCNLRTVRDGMPSQIFRVERAELIEGKFIPSPTGSFYRITHRPTGRYLGVIENEPTLLPLGATGWVWFSSPRLGSIPSQLVYIPDPALVPRGSDPEVWKEYLEDQQVLSPMNPRAGSDLILIPFQLEATPEARLAAFTFVDYSLIPLLKS